MFKKLLIATALCASFSAMADDSFTLKVKGLENGKFQNKHLLSAEYGFGCAGENISPEIEWKNAPKGTKSFVLTVYDKDAPTGLGWVHWEVVNIPANVSKLPAGIDAKDNTSTSTLNIDIARKVSAELVNAYDIVRFVKDNTNTIILNADISRKTNIDEITNYDIARILKDNTIAVTLNIDTFVKTNIDEIENAINATGYLVTDKKEY